MEQRICKGCGQTFTPDSARQIYCSPICRQRHWNKYGKDEESRAKTGPVIREFYCKKCGALVQVRSESDKRTAFCSRRCNKLYFKHPRNKERRWKEWTDV